MKVPLQPFPLRCFPVAGNRLIERLLWKPFVLHSLEHFIRFFERGVRRPIPRTAVQAPDRFISTVIALIAAVPPEPAVMVVLICDEPEQLRGCNPDPVIRLQHEKSEVADRY
jgi:hypothetical protein